MPFLSDLLIRIGGDASDLKKELSSARRDLAAWGRDLEGIGQKLTLGITLPMVGLGTAALKVAGELEQNTVAFKTLLGSADLAQQHLNQLKDFALKTPFQFTELTLASKRMQALGFSAKEVIPALTNIGDAASALGMGAEGLNRIVTALGQMKAKGTVQAEEMRQLAEAGIPAWEILAKTLNTDVAGAMKLVENRAVEASQAVPALLAGMNAKFGGLMAEQSKTLLGQWSNFKDALTFTLQDIGTTLAPMAKNMMQNLIQPMLNGLKDMAAGFAALPPGIQSASVAFAGFIAALGPIGLALGVTASGLKDLIGIAVKLPALLNPVTLGIAALATATGIAFYELNRATAGLSSLDKAFGEWITKLVKDSNDFAAAREKLNGALESGAIGLSQYNQLLSILDDRQKKAFGADFAEDMKARGIAINVVVDNTRKLLTSQEALNALGIASTAERKKTLEDARAAYNVLAKEHSEGSQVMAEALLKVKQAEEALFGASEKTNFSLSQFPKFGELGFQSAVQMEEFRRDLETRKKAVADFVDFQEQAQFKFKGKFKLFDDSLVPPIPEDFFKSFSDAVPFVEKLAASLTKLPPELQQMKEDLAAFGLGGEQIETLAQRMERLRQRQDEGAISLDTYNRALLKFLKDEDTAGRALSPEQRKLVIELQRQYGGQVRETSKVLQEFQHEVDRTFNAVARGIARSIVDWKGFGSTIKNIAKDFATGFLEIIIKQMIKPLEEQFAKLVGKIVSVFGGGTAPGGVLGTTVGAAGGAASTIGGTAGSVYSGVSGVAGSVGSTASSVAGTAGSSVAGIVGAAGAVAGAVSSIIGNFQMAGMNKSLDLLVQFGLKTANDLANLRTDAWSQFNTMYFRVGEIMNSVRDVNTSIRTVGMGSGGKGGVVVNFYGPVNGSAQQIADAIFEKAALAGGLV